MQMTAAIRDTFVYPLAVADEATLRIHTSDQAEALAAKAAKSQRRHNVAVQWILTIVTVVLSLYLLWIGTTRWAGRNTF